MGFLKLWTVIDSFVATHIHRCLDRCYYETDCWVPISHKHAVSSGAHQAVRYFPGNFPILRWYMMGAHVQSNVCTTCLQWILPLWHLICPVIVQTVRCCFKDNNLVIMIPVRWSLFVILSSSCYERIHSTQSRLPFAVSIAAAGSVSLWLCCHLRLFCLKLGKTLVHILNCNNRKTCSWLLQYLLMNSWIQICKHCTTILFCRHHLLHFSIFSIILYLRCSLNCHILMCHVQDDTLFEMRLCAQFWFDCMRVHFNSISAGLQSLKSVSSCYT